MLSLARRVRLCGAGTPRRLPPPCPRLSRVLVDAQSVGTANRGSHAGGALRLRYAGSLRWDDAVPGWGSESWWRAPTPGRAATNGNLS